MNPSVRGRPHYYSTKREQYASIRFSLTADLSSLFTWNTKQVFVWVSAAWPNGTAPAIAEEDEIRNGGKGRELVNEAVIWDVIITNPSADHLQNIKASAMRKLVKGSKGKSVDPSRWVLCFLSLAQLYTYIPTFRWFEGGGRERVWVSLLGSGHLMV